MPSDSQNTTGSPSSALGPAMYMRVLCKHDDVYEYLTVRQTIYTPKRNKRYHANITGVTHIHKIRPT